MADTPRLPRQHVKFTPNSEARAGAKGPSPMSGSPTSAAPGFAKGAPAAGPSAKPRVSVTPLPPEKSRSFRPALALTILVFAGLLAAGWHSLGQRPDPHFEKATKILNDYERGLAEEARNYNNDVYEQALTELKLVAPKSISFPEAQALRDDIVARRESFFVRLRESIRENSVREARDSEKRAELAARRAHSRMHPQVVFPECDEH